MFFLSLSLCVFLSISTFQMTSEVLFTRRMSNRRKQSIYFEKWTKQ